MSFSCVSLTVPETGSRQWKKSSPHGPWFSGLVGGPGSQGLGTLDCCVPFSIASPLSGASDLKPLCIVRPVEKTGLHLHPACLSRAARAWSGRLALVAQDMGSALAVQLPTRHHQLGDTLGIFTGQLSSSL